MAGGIYGFARGKVRTRTKGSRKGTRYPIHSSDTMVGQKRYSRKEYENLADQYAKYNAGKRPDGGWVGVIIESDDGSEQDQMLNFPTEAQAQIYGMYLVRSMGPGYFFRTFDGPSDRYIDEDRDTFGLTEEQTPEPRIVHTSLDADRDKVGIHIINPTLSELNNAIEDAQAKGFGTVYAHHRDMTAADGSAYHARGEIVGKTEIFGDVNKGSPGLGSGKSLTAGDKAILARGGQEGRDIVGGKSNIRIFPDSGQHGSGWTPTGEQAERYFARGHARKHPGYSPAGYDYVRAKTSYLIESEGMKPSQAYAVAHDYARRAGLKVPKNPNRARGFL